MKQAYKKYNSFFGIRIKKKYDANYFLNNLKPILNDKKNLVNLNQYYLAQKVGLSSVLAQML